MTLRLAFALLLSCIAPAFAVQAPGAADSPDIAISHRDRFYTSDQFSNTVSVIDPADNKLLGVIRLGDPTPGNLSPRGVHRLQLRNIYRYGNERDQTRSLCRPFAA